MNPFILKKTQDANLKSILDTKLGKKLKNLLKTSQNEISSLYKESPQLWPFFSNKQEKQAESASKAIMDIMFWLQNTSDDDHQEQQDLVEYSITACEILNNFLKLTRGDKGDNGSLQNCLDELTKLRDKIPENSQSIKYWGILTLILTPIVAVVEIALFPFELLLCCFGPFPFVLTTMLVDYTFFAFNKPIERVLDRIENLITDEMKEENVEQLVPR